MLGRDRSEERGKQERHKNGFGDRRVHLDPLIHVAEEGQEKLFITMLKRIPVAKGPDQLGEETEEKTRLEHQFEGGFGHALPQVPEELIADTGRRTAPYSFPIPKNRLIRFFFNRKSCSGSMADDPDHPDRVLLKFFVRISDGANELSLEISRSSHVVDNRKIGDVIKEAIDRDVPAKRILRRGPEAVGPDDISLFGLNLLEFGVAPECGDLDNLLPFEENMNEAKPPANGPAVPEKGVNLMGMGIGGQVEIFWDPSEQKVPHTSADEIGQESMPVEPVEDLQRLFVDHAS